MEKHQEFYNSRVLNKRRDGGGMASEVAAEVNITSGTKS